MRCFYLVFLGELGHLRCELGHLRCELGHLRCELGLDP
jgi:hypothetical protein